MRRTLLTLVAIGAIALSPILAQDQQPQQPGPQPGPDDQQQQIPEPDGQYEQGRAVARIALLNGDVSVRRGDSGDVVAAGLNAPLMAGDSIMTSSSSRTEVQLDWANMVRIAPNSDVRFSALDVKGFQVQIAAGTLIFRVLRESRAQSEIDTPSVAIHPLTEGIYRVSVRDDGTSEISVRAGEAEIYSPHGSERLAAGKTMYARGPASDPEFQVVAAIPADSWDRWNADRDQYLLSSRSYAHVSHDIYGAEDLDQNGQWVNDQNYGTVWQPTVAQGWSPYQNGQWSWSDYYGWTWVSYEPWGWAPYHYGRWFWGPAGWCWYPGPVFASYFWAPAYVGFFGWGGGFGFGFGFGGLGWVPLAPFEVFHPWWGRGFYGGFHSGVLVHNTIINHVNVANVYRNARVTGGVMGVNANEFGHAGAQFQRLNSTQIQQAGLVRGAVPVSPTRSSLQLSNRAVSGSFAQTHNTSFASHMQTPRVNRVSFQQQQRTMQTFSHPNVVEGSRVGVGNSPAGSRGFGGNGAGGAGANGAGASHGWSRFGEPIHGSSGSSAGTSGGWQRSQSVRPGGSSGSGSGQAIRISPPIVQQRSSPNYSSPSYSAPRGYSSTPAPRNNESSSGSSRGSSSGSSSRGSSGSSAPRSSGGGGHASGSGHGGGGRSGGHR